MEPGQRQNKFSFSEHRIKDISGVILAGGKSSRFGKNKALEKIDGVPLIERVIRVMQSVFQHLILVTNNPAEYSYLELPMYGDLINDLGPLGGVYTALTVIPDNTGFFVACDMPFLNRDLILHMVEALDDFDAVVPRISGELETLHTLYSKRCLPSIRRLIDLRKYQIGMFFPEVSVCYIDESRIRYFDPELKSFININKPQELRRINKR